MYHKTLADGLFVLAFCAIALAGVGSTVGDIWLASTQWVMVAIVFLLVAIYVKLSKEEDEEIIKKYRKANRRAKKK